MKLTFTEEQIANELHKIYLEEDDLLMEGEFVTGEGKNYRGEGGSFWRDIPKNLYL